MTIYQAEVRRSKHAFKKSTLALCIAALTAAHGHAQDTAVDEPAALEEVVIYGVKQSLQNAQDIKRDSDTFVDAVSASDIGALPDRSVLEAMQRIPGVSIERFAAADDPDHFSVEGSGVVIRGLTQTRSEFNGRDAFTANSGRGLSFQDVPPELMGSVEIFKNQTADMIEGGISGTVNLKTRKPFDTNARAFAFTLDATYSDFSEETTPAGSLLFSDVWDTDIGSFGLLLNVAGSNMKARTDGVQVDLYVPRTNIDENGNFDADDGGNYLVPRGANVRTQEHDRDREGYAAVLQWASPDDSIVVTGEFIRSESTNAWVEHAIEFQDQDHEYEVYANPDHDFGFNSDGIFTHGNLVVDYGSRYRFEQDQQPVGLTETRAPTGMFGSKYAAITRAVENTNLVTDYALNAVFKPNEKLTIEADLQYVEAEVDNLDLSIANGFFAETAVDLRGSTPRVSYSDPFATNSLSSPAGGDHLSDPSSYFLRHAMDHIETSKGESTAFAMDFDYELDGGFFTSIESGFRVSSREQENKWAIYNWKALSEEWTNWGASNAGPAWLDDHGELGGVQVYDAYSFDNFHRGGVFGNQGQSLLFPAVSLVTDYNLARDVLGEYKALPGSTWRPLPDRVLENADGDPVNPDWADGGPNGEPAGPNGECWGNTDCYVNIATVAGGYLPEEVNSVKEDNQALYLKLNFGSDDHAVRYSGNVGLRYVNLDTETAGYVVYPDLTPDTDGDPKHNLPDEDRAFGNAGFTETSTSSNYSTVLPSFNLKLGVTDDVILRFALAKAIALPNIGMKRNYVSIDADRVVEVDDDTAIVNFYKSGDTGNPMLKPMEAVQYDLSFEWYFSDVGSLTATMFGKKLKNYYIDGAFPQQFTNNGVTQTVEVSGPVNGDGGNINGFEIGYQQFYDFLPEPWNGLGMQFNYTYVGSSGTPNANLGNFSEGSDNDRTDTAFPNLPLQGLSTDTYNFALMYQMAPVEVRLAYNWRSEYLLTTRDVITGLPVYNDDYGQLDGSIFYDLTDNFKVGLQVTNLLDATTKTLMQVDAEGTKLGRSWFLNDRRASLVLRGTF